MNEEIITRGKKTLKEGGEGHGYFCEGVRRVGDKLFEPLQIMLKINL